MRFVYPDVTVVKTLMIDRFRRSDQSNIVFFSHSGRSAGSDDLQELRVLIAERNHYSKLATQCSNRINNIILRFCVQTQDSHSRGEHF